MVFIIRLTTLLGLLAMSYYPVFSQEPTPPVDEEPLEGFVVEKRDFKIAAVNTPSKAVNADEIKRGNLKDKEWLEIDVKYSADPKEIESDYLDLVQVKIHLLMPELPDAETPDRAHYVITLNYGPIAKSRENYAVAYLPPGIVGKYGGANKIKLKANVAMEILFEGKIVADGELLSAGERAGDEFWYRTGGTEGVLLPLSRTPWAMDYWERYPPLLESQK